VLFVANAGTTAAAGATVFLVAADFQTSVKKSSLLRRTLTDRTIGSINRLS